MPVYLRWMCLDSWGLIKITFSFSRLAGSHNIIVGWRERERERVKALKNKIMYVDAILFSQLLLSKFIAKMFFPLSLLKKRVQKREKKFHRDDSSLVWFAVYLCKWIFDLLTSPAKIKPLSSFQAVYGVNGWKKFVIRGKLYPRIWQNGNLLFLPLLF